jgi:hypothetical protein
MVDQDQFFSSLLGPFSIFFYGSLRKLLLNRTRNSSRASSNLEKPSFRIRAANPMLRSVPTIADQ